MLTSCFHDFPDLTECQRRFREVSGQPSVGAYIPQCTPDGGFVPRQCHRSTGHCWCVNEEGEELVGTRREPGQGDVVCDAIGKYLINTVVFPGSISKNKYSAPTKISNVCFKGPQ